MLIDRCIALVVALSASSCGGDRSPVGTYVLDVSEFTSGMTPEEVELARVELRLEADMTFQMIGRAQGRGRSTLRDPATGQAVVQETSTIKPMVSSGTYTLAGNTITIRRLKLNDEEHEPEESSGRYENGTVTFLWGESMIFRRK